MTPRDLDIWARTVWGEAEGEPTEGKIAVAWSIKDRLDADRRHYGRGSVIAVCLHPRAYSLWNTDEPRRIKALAIDESDSVFQECQTIVAGIARGMIDRPFDSPITHYHADSIEPSWASSRQMHFLGKIGRHMFFRED